LLGVIGGGGYRRGGDEDKLTVTANIEAISQTLDRRVSIPGDILSPAYMTPASKPEVKMPKQTPNFVA
jgi:hypothetical protein